MTSISSYFAFLSPIPTPNSVNTSSNSCRISPFFNSHYRRLHVCNSGSSSVSTLSYITEFDLYDLLGVDCSSDQRAIKMAYRSLQKRCHPDIAGPAGHDMAIILNEAYAVLSDPVLRSAYDKEQAKSMELQGYTGTPLYSVWMGAETEKRAVFVDEVKCVGCLKCALFAENTFKIESVYGRARVVAQWADPEPNIQESIDACPVDCISIVERSDLAALEFLMSKQPRERVRVGASNTGGARVFDVFSEVKVLQKRIEEAKQRKTQLDSKFSAIQNNARMSAIQTIRSISNWLYWKPPGLEFNSSLVLRPERCYEREINKLRKAAEARRNVMLKARETTRFLPQTTSNDEYWVPLTDPICQAETKNKSSAQPTKSSPPPFKAEQSLSNKTYVRDSKNGSPFLSGIPFGLFFVASSYAKFSETDKAIGRLDEHIAGSVALEIVNSPWLQVFLAGVTWYFIGLVIIYIVKGLVRKEQM